MSQWSVVSPDKLPPSTEHLNMTQRFSILSRNSLFLFAILFAGVLLRIFHLLDYASFPILDNPLGADVSEYDKWARSILCGRFLWTEVPIHAPLYPYFLAGLLKICHTDYFYVRLLQSLLGLFGGFLLFLRIKSLCWDLKDFRRFTPHLFLLFFALYPPFIVYGTELISEALMLPLLCMSVFFFPEPEKKGSIKSLFLCGLAGGMAAISHPVVLFYLLAVAFFIMIHEKKMVPLLSFLLGCGLFILPVSGYNTFLKGSPVTIQDNSAFNFYLGNNPDATGLCYISPGPAWKMIHDKLSNEAKKQDISKERQALRSSLSWISGHPLDYGKLVLKKAVYALNFRETGTWSDIAPLHLLFFHRYFSGFFAMIAIPGLAMLLTGISNRNFRKRFQIFLCLFFSLYASQILLVTSGRYRMGLCVPLMLFAACFITSLPHLTTRKTILSAGIALLTATLLVLLPVTPQDIPNEKAHAYGILAEVFFKTGNPTEAERYIVEAEKELSHWDRIGNLHAGILAKQGRVQEAKELYLELTRRFPASHYAYMNYAALLSDEGKREEAEHYFDLASERVQQEGLEDLFYNKGLFDLRTGRFQEAERCFSKALSLAPEHRKALNSHAVLLLMRGDFQSAENEFRKALTMEPNNTGIKINLILAMFKNGKMDEARKAAEKWMKEKPDSPEILNLTKMFPELVHGEQ